MKKNPILLVSFVLAATLLGGCGSGDQTTEAAPPVQQDNPKGLNVQEDKGNTMAGAPGAAGEPAAAASRAGARTKGR